MKRKHTVKLSEDEMKDLLKAQTIIIQEGLGNPRLKELIGGPNTCGTTDLGVIVRLGALAICEAFGKGPR